MKVWSYRTQEPFESEEIDNIWKDLGYEKKTSGFMSKYPMTRLFFGDREVKVERRETLGEKFILSLSEESASHLDVFEDANHGIEVDSDGGTQMTRSSIFSETKTSDKTGEKSWFTTPAKHRSRSSNI